MQNNEYMMYILYFMLLCLSVLYLTSCSTYQDKPLLHPGQPAPDESTYPGPILIENRGYGPQTTVIVPQPVNVPVPVASPVSATPQYKSPFSHEHDYSNSGTVECIFNNVGDRDAQIMIKREYYASRGPFSPVRRAIWSYIDIPEGSSKMMTFQTIPNEQYNSFQVIVHKGEVKYDCKFGRR